MAGRRARLSDLHKGGHSTTFDAPEGTVEVWIEKPSEYQMKETVQKAGAARARLNALKWKGQEDENRAAMETQAEIQGWFDDPEMVKNLLIAEDLGKISISIDAELRSTGEWGEDDYLEGLVESWEDDLKARYALDPTDEQAAHVLAEMERYEEELDQKVQKERKKLLAEYERMGEPALRTRIVDYLIEVERDAAWKEELEFWTVYFGTRDPDSHLEIYWSSPEELRGTDPQIRKQLLDELQELMLPNREVKD